MENSKQTDREGSVAVKYLGAKPIVMVGAWPHDVKMLTSPADLAEWERRMEAFTGVKYSAKDVIAGGGGCCGGDGDGMCDLA